MRMTGVVRDGRAVVGDAHDRAVGIREDDVDVDEGGRVELGSGRARVPNEVEKEKLELNVNARNRHGCRIR